MQAAGPYQWETAPASVSNIAGRVSSQRASGDSGPSSTHRLRMGVVTRCEADRSVGNVSNESLVPGSITISTRISTESAWDSSLASPQFGESTDPRHWGSRQNRIAFYLVLWICLLNGFSIGFGDQMKVRRDRWGIKEPDWALAWIFSLTAAMHGIGGCFIAPFVQRFGSLPTLFWSSIFVLVAGVVCSFGVNTWALYVSARAVEGFFGSAATIIGIHIMYDLYPPGLWITKIGVWATVVTLGPAAGSLVSALIDVNWRIGFICLAGAHLLDLIAVIALMQETRRDRAATINSTPSPTGWLRGRYEGLFGIAGYRSKDATTLWDATRGIAYILWRPQFCVPALIQVLQWSLVSALEDKIVHILFFQDKDEYGLDSRISSLIYLVPLVGLFIGQLWGYFFNRRLQNRDIEKHSSIIPETVFIGCYLPILVEFVGFLAFALSSHHRYNWIGLVLGWGFVVFAASNILVATSVYTLYCFPAHAASTAAVLGFLRAAAAFTSQFYATGWVAKVGTYGCLGIQAAGLSICALLVVTVQRSGEGWRKRFHWDGEVKVVELPLLTLSEPATAAEEAGAGLTTGVWDGT